MLIPFEIAWLPKFAWYSTATLSDVVSDVSGTVPPTTGLPANQYTGLYGFYLNFAQQITRNASLDPKGGLNAFVNFSIADEQTSATWLQVAGGLIYTGPFISRPHDQVAFAAGTTQVNPRLIGAQNTLSGLGLQPNVVRHSEYVFELQYGLVPVPGLTLRPNIQYVYRPGAISHNVNILVLGLKTVINF